MIMSSYEIAELFDCATCMFVDKDKLKQVKKHHENEEWEKCGNVKYCTFPFKKQFTDGECLEHKEGEM